ncbi:unnamed protein product [Penicillium camemberti]|uniref:Str. FM013 n=1 Tax=Penicillium camemberti (strain FM 013) TaxID=1429867 RepID=A0A0G4PBA1_PENC3|nr:unnamed protein product [Penicillium camemberti]
MSPAYHLPVFLPVMGLIASRGLSIWVSDALRIGLDEPLEQDGARGDDRKQLGSKLNTQI